jgi:hypothetical protein
VHMLRHGYEKYVVSDEEHDKVRLVAYTREFLLNDYADLSLRHTG